MGKHTRLSNIFRGMKLRCYCSNNKDYERYGGRGITICDEWLNTEHAKGEHNSSVGFQMFKKWALENGYADNLTIDRIDVNKGYSPENCRWVSIKVQCNNRRNNHYVTYMGKRQSLADWCRELNLNYEKILSKIQRSDWSAEQVLQIATSSNSNGWCGKSTGNAI